jgi:hypothetical protein
MQEEHDKPGGSALVAHTYIYWGYALLVTTPFLVMASRNVHAQALQSTRSPESMEALLDLDIEELLEVDIRTGQPGWFGTQLEQLQIKPYVHGYISATYRDYDLNRTLPIDSFDLHYFNILIGTKMGEKIAAEILLEYEHGGDDTGVRYGIVDYEFNESAILRMGKFLVPMGRFNEYLSPEYANKLPDRPYCLWKIVPIVWAETGVQMRGQFNLSSSRSLNYAVYIVNGLEQAPNPDGTVAEGGNIRSMRANNRDSNNSDKAIGGRIGFKPSRPWEFGISYYSGAYTSDGRQNLSILDFDAQYRKAGWTVRGEYVRALEETSVDDLNKHGYYAEAAYRLNRKFEPVVRYDRADLDDGSGHDVSRSTVGLVFYPQPDLNPLFQFKVSQSFVDDDGTGASKHEFVLECVIGF